jgi:hypothetical protein
MALECLAMESGHRAGSARLRLMILSGHDSVTASGLGFCQRAKSDHVQVQLKSGELLG